MATTPALDADNATHLYCDIGENFLFAEDEALKAYLKGITVADDKNPARPVGVWFAMPDMEVRDQSFPFMVIELLSVVEANDREMRGLMKVINDPGATEPYLNGVVRYAMTPLPFNLVYQVAAYSRHPRHNRQIIATMLSQKLPGRLLGLAVPGDGSKRTMELLSWNSHDTVEGGRKLWASVFTVQVTSEISDVNTTSVLSQVVGPPAVLINLIEEDF